MLVVMLRWRGHDIKYLGQSLPFEQLGEVIERIHPRMLMFTATSAEGAQALFGLTDELNKIKKNRPLLVVGGQGFAGQPIPENFTGVCLTGAPSHLVERIESLLATKTVKNY
jgi:methanogenic corrinoid protein MtbC1